MEDLEKEQTPFKRERHLLILPDNISINNLKIYVSREKPQVNNKLECETFESIAKKIIKEKRDHDPSILENHYLRVFVTQYIQNSAKLSDVSKKINDIIEKSDRPERTQVIEDLVREFSDYLRTVYPPSLKDPSIRNFHTDLIRIARSDEIDDYEGKKAENILDFFKKMESFIQYQMNEFFNNRYYLSRSHLVGEAAEEIKEDYSLLENVLDGIESMRVLAIPILDPTTIGLLEQISENYNEVKVVSGIGTHDRLKKRLKNIFDEVEVSIEKDEFKDEDVEKWELPNPRQEIEFVGSLMQDEMDVEDSIVIARESSVYLPYANEVLRDFGLPSHVQTRRNLSLSVPFRLAASLLNLVEKDEWTVEDISNPLRLGLVLNYYGEPSTLPDQIFLQSEYWLNKKIKFEDEDKFKPEEWMDLFSENSITRSFIEQLRDWKEEVVDKDNILEKLKSELGKFQKYACHVKREREARNGLLEKEYNRAEITKTHMTGDAQRVIGLIDRADNFSNFISDIEGDSSRTIQHMIKAFWIVGGGETFGKPRRDKQAVKFVDAANSFFLPEKNRIILGMRSGTFPREPPEAKFLPTSFREKVNDQYEKLYLQDPETDYENELDFFEAAMGPDRDEKKIYHLNPYLDDRGHRNNWSVFSPDDEVTHVRPADFYLKDATKEDEIITDRSLLSCKPKSRWQKSIDTYRKNDNLSKSDLTSHFDNDENHLIGYEIIPRVKEYEDRIKTDKPYIAPPNSDEEEYLEEMLEEQRNDPVPSHEIDLWVDCPIKYYFYRFVFYQPHWDQGNDGFEKGSRLFIPEYWNDFDIGSIPHVLMRAYFSSRGHNFISNFVKPYVDGERDDIEEIRNELSDYNCRNNTEENLNALLDLVEDKRFYIQLGEDEEWKYHGSSSLDMLRPPVIKFFDEGDAPGTQNHKYVSLARYGYRGLTVQNCRFCFGNWIPKDDRYNYLGLYQKLRNKIKEDDLKSFPLREIFVANNLFRAVENGLSDWEGSILKDLISQIQNLENIEGYRQIKLDWQTRKCEDCVYRRLCGDWEVLE